MTLFPRSSPEPVAPFAGLLGAVDPLLPPGQIPPCAHAAYVEHARAVMREHPDWEAGRVRGEAMSRMEGL